MHKEHSATSKAQFGRKNIKILIQFLRNGGQYTKHMRQYSSFQHRLKTCNETPKRPLFAKAEAFRKP